VIEGATTQEMLENAYKIIESLEREVDDLKHTATDRLMVMRHYRAVELLSIEYMYWNLWSRRSGELTGLLKEGTVSLCIAAGRRIELLEQRKKELIQMLEDIGELSPRV
jgi:hypothetical protein